jgi:hypothetical protein
LSRWLDTAPQLPDFWLGTLILVLDGALELSADAIEAVVLCPGQSAMATETAPSEKANTRAKAR